MTIGPMIDGMVGIPAPKPKPPAAPAPKPKPAPKPPPTPAPKKSAPKPAPKPTVKPAAKPPTHLLPEDAAQIAKTKPPAKAAPKPPAEPAPKPKVPATVAAHLLPEDAATVAGPKPAPKSNATTPTAASAAATDDRATQAATARYQGMAVKHFQSGHDDARSLDSQTSGADRKFFNQAQQAFEAKLATATSRDEIHEIYTERYAQGGTYLLDGVAYRAVYNPATRQLHLSRTGEAGEHRTERIDRELIVEPDGTMRVKESQHSGRRSNTVSTRTDTVYDRNGNIVSRRGQVDDTNTIRRGGSTTSTTIVESGRNGQVERTYFGQERAGYEGTVTRFERTNHRTGAVETGEVFRKNPEPLPVLTTPVDKPEPDEEKGFWEHVGGFFKGLGESAADVGSGVVELWQMSRRSGLNPVFLYDLATDPDRAISDLKSQWQANAGLVGGALGTVGLAIVDGVSQPVEELLWGAGQVFDSDTLIRWSREFDGAAAASRLIGSSDNSFLAGLDAGLEGEFAQALWEGVTAPIVDDWNSGNETEAAGRVAFEVFGVLLDVMSGGSSRAARTAGRMAGVADDLADTVRVAKLDDLYPGMPRTLNKGKQDIHILGTGNHRNNPDVKSLLDHPDPQRLIDEYAGSGVLKDPKRAVETVDFGQEIGTAYQIVALTEDGRPIFKPVRTSVGAIHYGNDGAHIVPVLPPDVPQFANGLTSIMVKDALGHPKMFNRSDSAIFIADDVSITRPPNRG